jgi:hypothetical protein
MGGGCWAKVKKIMVTFFVEFVANILLNSYFVVGSNIFPVTMFLDEFAKVRKAIIGFVMSVRPSVCPHGTTLLPLDGF